MGTDELQVYSFSTLLIAWKHFSSEFSFLILISDFFLHFISFYFYESIYREEKKKKMKIMIAFPGSFMNVFQNFDITCMMNRGRECL
jgi:hypothetical protein